MSMDNVGIEEVATEVGRLYVSREPAKASSCTVNQMSYLTENNHSAVEWSKL